MTRRALAVSLVLALAACFGRVTAFAAPSAIDHSCCHGADSAPTKTPSFSDCCPVPAASSSVEVVRIAKVFVAVAVAAVSFKAPSAVESASVPVPVVSSPPFTRGSSSPRSPPL